MSTFREKSCRTALSASETFSEHQHFLRGTSSDPSALHTYECILIVKS